MINKIGIFTGKQKEYNTKVLTLLYDNEPLSAWKLTAKIRKIGRNSLHATLNKRLRSLEEKGYVRRKERKWHLRFKGIISVLLIQHEPKMWNSKWTEIFEENAKITAEYSKPILKVDKATIQDGIKSLGLCLDDFNAWVNISKKVKELIEDGVINFDLIKEEDLLAIIIMKTKTLEQLSGLFRQKGDSSN
jgi:hypothetical protein